MKIVFHIIYIGLISFFAYYTFLQKGYAEENLKEAEKQAYFAQEALKDAERLEEEATSLAADAIREKHKAEAAREEAETLI
ncbi:MAG: hypothetical protein ABJN36_13560 [Cyclobacteriaceae bacterium]